MYDCILNHFGIDLFLWPSDNLLISQLIFLLFEAFLCSHSKKKNQVPELKMHLSVYFYYLVVDDIEKDVLYFLVWNWDEMHYVSDAGIMRNYTAEL